MARRPHTGAASGATDRSSAMLAPRWHTAILIGLMLSVAMTGLLLGARATAPVPGGGTADRIVRLYLPTIVVQWVLAAYVIFVGRRRNAFSFLLGAGWFSLRRAMTDLAIAACAIFAIEGSEFLAARVWDARHGASVVALLPSSPGERTAWVLFAVSAGVCEELVYRGYLQTQLRAFTRSTSIAILSQAALFGLAHGEQGAFVMVRFGLYGVGLGILAWRRKSLAAGMVAHVAIDLLSGLSRGV